MKRSVILSLSAFALMLGVSGSAFATRFRISDPPSPTPIYGLGEPLTVAWSDCGTGDVCTTYENDSGSTITSLLFQFTATDVLAGQTLECDATGIFSSNDCDDIPEMVSGDSYTFRFWGGAITSGEVPELERFLAEEFVAAGPGFQLDMTSEGLDVDNAPPMTMTAFAVPEPGELAVFGLGLLLVGAGVGLRRRWQ